MKDIPEILPRQFRTLTVVREAVEGDDNRFAFALTSETPVQQWFGKEVLGHDNKSVRQTRLKEGIPLLFNHDPDQHLGVVDSYSLKDKKLRVEGKWSASAFAQEKKRDYNDGILKDASGGYLIHKIVRDQVGENPSDEDTLNVTDWEPMEASLVTIPADPTVGVGRSAEGSQSFPVTVEVVRRGAVATPEVQPAVPAPAAIPAIEVTRMETTQQPDVNAIEFARRDRIMALASDKDFSKHVSIEEARAAIENKTSAEAFAESISRKIVAANDASKVGTVGTNVLADLGKDAKRYSFVTAHREAINMVKPGSFRNGDATMEREVSAEIAKRLKQETLGMYIPNSVTRTQTASATGAGLAALTSFVSTVTESEVIEMYRNRARVLALGASRLGGLSGIVRLPRQLTASSGQWLGETTAVTASNVTTDFVAITPKRWSIQNAYTVELLAESSPDVEGMLARDRAKVQALAIDFASINGPTGGASPVGVLNTSGLATINSSGTTLTTGKALAYADWLAFESTLAAANADGATSGFLVTPETRGQAKGTPMFPAGYAAPIWASNQRNPDGLEVGPLGYMAGVTNQMPKNLGAGTNLHAALFGDFSQLIVADYGASELIVDPYTQAGAGVYVVTERVLMDIEIRHISAFVACETVAVV